MDDDLTAALEALRRMQDAAHAAVQASAELAAVTRALADATTR